MYQYVMLENAQKQWVKILKKDIIKNTYIQLECNINEYYIRFYDKITNYAYMSSTFFDYNEALKNYNEELYIAQNCW